jgi:hypothetical protein
MKSLPHSNLRKAAFPPYVQFQLPVTNKTESMQYQATQQIRTKHSTSISTTQLFYLTISNFNNTETSLKNSLHLLSNLKSAAEFTNSVKRVSEEG